MQQYIQDLIDSFICNTKLRLYSAVIFGYSICFFLFTIIYRIILRYLLTRLYLYNSLVAVVSLFSSSSLIKVIDCSYVQLYKITRASRAGGKMPSRNHIERYYDFAIYYLYRKIAFTFWYTLSTDELTFTRVSISSSRDNTRVTPSSFQTRNDCPI